MKSKARKRETLENFGLRVTDPYFSILARASVEIGNLNSQLQSALFVNEIDSDTDSVTHRLLSDICNISTDISFGFVERWINTLDEARTMVANALLEFLDPDMLNLFKLQLEGSLENGCEELAVLCLVVFDWLKDGHETTSKFNQPMTLAYAKWLVIDHTLYQMRGADFKKEVKQIEKWLGSEVAKPATPIMYGTNFLLDQFISEDASAKKYGLTVQLEKIRDLKRQDAIDAGCVK